MLTFPSRVVPFARLQRSMAPVAIRSVHTRCSCSAYVSAPPLESVRCCVWLAPSSLLVLICSCLCVACVFAVAPLLLSSPLLPLQLRLLDIPTLGDARPKDWIHPPHRVPGAPPTAAEKADQKRQRKEARSAAKAERDARAATDQLTEAILAGVGGLKMDL